MSLHAPMQTGLIQETISNGSLPLSVSHSLPIPDLPSTAHVLVRVLAVALNPTDHKMFTNFPIPGNMVGCDFCGVIEKCHGSLETTPVHPPGTRVFGAVFPYSYNPDGPRSGGFAQWVVADSRLLLRVPESWDDLQGAALGSIGWGTLSLAFYGADALDLQGRPSKPIESKEPVLVYGASTATGTMACQLLKLSGYSPIAVTSTKSASLAVEYGAVGSAIYTSPTCVDTIRSFAMGTPIRRALDCITSAESSAICFAAIARTGGRYACLEKLKDSWRTRQAVRTKEVMGYESLGIRIDVGSTPYSRDASPEALRSCVSWAQEMQSLLDTGAIKTHPVREVSNQWQGIIDGLHTLQKGGVRAEKLVVKIGEIDVS